MRYGMLIFAGLLLPALSFAGPLNTWSWLYPQPTAFSLFGVTHGAGQFVAVGEGGVIVRSPNGTNWSIAREGSAGTNLFAITWGDGKFVAVGPAGVIMTSPDAANWTSRRPFQVDLYSVAYGSGRFVAVGGDYITNCMQTSVDGVTWQVVTNLPAPEFGGFPLAAIAWGERFVAAGGYPAEHIIFSDDGLTWQRVTNAPNFYEIRGITYGNGLYVATGPYTYAYSTNGSAWRTAPSFVGHYQEDVAYGNGYFVAVGNTGIAGYSSDATNWIGLSGAFPGTLYDIVHADGRFVAVGDRGRIITSLTGTNWPTLPGPRYTPWVGCGPHGCVVIDYPGNGSATTNFTDWTPIEIDYLRRVDYLNGQYIGLGQTGLLHLSESLGDWRTVSIPATNTFYEASFGHGRYVLGGTSGTLATSTNLLDWNILQLPITNHLHEIAFGNGRFVAKSYLGDVAVSTNGTDWAITPPVPEYFDSLTFGNGAFLVLYSTGTVLRTSDGLTWTSMTRPNSRFSDLTFAHGTFLMCGGDNSGACLFASRDATNWTRYALPYVSAFTTITSYDDRVIVNSDARLLQSGLFPRLQIAAPFQLSLTGAAGSYQIQSSEMIEGPWQTITNLTAPAHWTISATNGPRRFYRAVHP